MILFLFVRTTKMCLVRCIRAVTHKDFEAFPWWIKVSVIWEDIRIDWKAHFVHRRSSGEIFKKQGSKIFGHSHVYRYTWIFQIGQTINMRVSQTRGQTPHKLKKSSSQTMPQKARFTKFGHWNGEMAVIMQHWSIRPPIIAYRCKSLWHRCETYAEKIDIT